METIPIDKDKTLALYKKKDAKGKKELEEIFGKSFFIGKITDRITSMDAVFKELGIKKGTKLVGYIHPLLAMHAISIEKYAELILATEVLNEGWIPDYTNSKDEKWEIWFNLSSGSGLSFDVVADTISLTSVGSRLVFKTRALAQHAAKYFLQDYSDFITIKKATT